MGVKDLWSILSPVARKKSLYELEGKTVAVDLSCWVCEGQSIGENVLPQPRMYLRNLYFRTQTLLMLNITPIFVLEGVPPEIKLDVMKQRTNARFKITQSLSNQNKSSKRTMMVGRSRFQGLLKQCREMLQKMGVLCIQSDGEAEALCAQLEIDGIVDGVISQDSDVFLYGAKTVYRNIAIKSGNGTVDLYLMSDIEEKLNLSREKLIAMSLLCGCDYDPDGVRGIGKELAFRYVSAQKGDVLQRLRNLKSDKVLMQYEEEKANCVKCCHQGSASVHRKNGCPECIVSKGCIENESSLCYKNKSEEEKKLINIELSIRRKVLEDDQFPCQKTIDEYSSFRQVLPDIDGTWKMPNICSFCSYCGKMLEWELDYSFEKILPLLTRWLLLHYSSYIEAPLTPREVVKKRIVKGVPSLDVIWDINDVNVKSLVALLSDECVVLKEEGCTSTEPLAILSERLSKLISSFTEKNKKKKKSSAPKMNKINNRKSLDDFEDITNRISSLSIALSQPTSSKLEEKHAQNIFSTFSSPNHLKFDDSLNQFLSDSPNHSWNRSVITSRTSDVRNHSSSEEAATSNQSSTTVEMSNLSFSFDDESTVDYDVSLIVDEIISRKQFY